MRLLVTRPEPDAARTAAALRARGHSVVISPLMRIEPLPNAAIGTGPWEAVLVTSANIAHAITDHAKRAELIRLPVFAVGERSAQAMRTLGCVQVISAGGNAGGLARIVAAHLDPPARLLYLAGEQRSGDLGVELRTKGFAVETVAIYRAVASEILPPAAADALARGAEGVLHFSRRSAETYVDAARAVGLLESALRPVQFCLSARVAAPLQDAGCRLVRIAPYPAEVALLDLIGAD